LNFLNSGILLCTLFPFLVGRFAVLV
jgi:hypothetical protein